MKTAEHIRDTGDAEDPSVSTLPTAFIEIGDDDQTVVKTVLRDVEMLQTAIGAECERHADAYAQIKAQQDAETKRHLDEQKKLLAAIAAARRKYRDVVNVLAEKHVKRPGKYDFRPEIGAFVARG